MSDIIKTQRSLAIKAKYQPQHQFEHLYRLICREDWMNAALKAVLSNQGAKTAGIDGITKKTLNSNSARAEFVRELQEQLRSQQFRPLPVRRVYIPKKDGKQRPLGIPTISDRVVQMLLKMVLEPIYESDFLNCSNGFRPQRRTQNCIALLDSYINRRNKYYWVIEGDIKAAFDSIHHEILLKILSQRIADSRLLQLVERFLKAGVMEGCLFQQTECGTPQGGICSPLLANIQRLFLWLQKRHKLSPRRILEMYKLRENGKRYNLGIRNGDKYQFLYRMSDLSLTKYRSRSPENPYLDGEWMTEVSLAESSLPKQIWKGNADNSQWRELKEEIKAERGSKCELCGSTENLDLHHIIARRKKGNELKENLQLLCRSCHVQTPSFGRPKQQ